MQKVPIKREQSKGVCSAEREERATQLNNSLVDGWFINDFHRRNSMAAQREVQQMSLHPCSREQNMHDENVIRSNKSNTIFVVDCDIRINTPELRQGGTRVLSNEVICK